MSYMAATESLWSFREWSEQEIKTTQTEGAMGVANEAKCSEMKDGMKEAYCRTEKAAVTMTRELQES